MKALKRLGVIVMLIMLMSTGCNSKETTMEDYVRSNPVKNDMNSVMKSDTGYYYGNSVGEMSLHYYDINSGQNIFLCSKPECRHDGDVFCIATNSKYEVDKMCMYGGELYVNVVEETDTEYKYKFLKVSADGTKLTELVTYMTVNKTSLVPLIGNAELMIHRGYMAVTYTLANRDNYEEGVKGICIYNISDGKITMLPETELKNSLYKVRFCGYGNYIYYNVQEGKKIRLHRFSLNSEAVEEMNFVVNYSGMYEVWDDDNIYYLRRAGDTLYKYSISTGENKEYKDLLTYDDTLYQSEGYTYSDGNGLDDLVTDGTYLYVGQRTDFHDTCVEAKIGYGGGLPDVEYAKSYVYVYDKNLKQIAQVPIETEKYLGYSDYFSLAILDGTVYLQTPEKVFACSVEDFITAAEPPFCEVYSNEIDIPSVRNWK